MGLVSFRHKRSREADGLHEQAENNRGCELKPEGNRSQYATEADRPAREEHTGNPRGF